ncbi:uncharacterized protein LOC111716401 [Eurytemora carolleeae]|uniref:uncharacterized protein LOC111716401 n=1 Tax=Eurytemora carolleeae TaxID=1294199 RepID=UPI000C789AAB|nr:uncharacterized protein LOC111716401 [Eurytemora carolleeae]|eukprot:XP_023347622.1 uncharacterized protein LOC111716401 [Eurytemora affinis]
MLDSTADTESADHHSDLHSSHLLSKKSDHLHLYMSSCVILCWFSCAPNIHFIFRICREKSLILANLLTLAFVLANFTSVIATSLDALRLEQVRIPPVIRLGLFGACLFFIQLEILKQYLLFFCRNKDWIFSVKFSLGWIVAALVAGFLLGHFLIMLDPNLNQEAPEHNPHAFWRNETMLYYVILPSIATLFICILMLAIMLFRTLWKPRGIKDGAKGPGRNLEHGLPPPDTVEPYTIAVDDQQPTAGDLNMQTRMPGHENLEDDKCKKQEVLKTTIFLSLHIVFFIICLFIC